MLYQLSYVPDVAVIPTGSQKASPIENRAAIVASIFAIEAVDAKLHFPAPTTRRLAKAPGV